MVTAFAAIDATSTEGHPYTLYLSHRFNPRSIQVTIPQAVFLLQDAAAGQLLRGLGQWLAEGPHDQLAAVDADMTVHHPAPVLDSHGRPVLTEYARITSGGGLQWYSTSPEVEAIFPLADRIAAAERHGGRVVRRRVIVVEDWGRP
jgi:hypothetical protein